MKQQAIVTENAPRAIGPYSQAIVAGDFLYVSGQIPLDPATGNVVSNEVEGQTRQALQNLKNILEAAGSGIEMVIKTTVFVKDLNDFATINTIYGQYFAEPYPARACIEVSRLPKDVLVEIEAVALLK